MTASCRWRSIWPPRAATTPCRCATSASRADVALGTIYRYFTSKDQLLISAMADWTGQLRRRLEQRPPRGATAADQVVDVLQRACRSLERQPRLAAALVKAMSSSEVGVSEANLATAAHIRGMIEPLLADVDDETREGVIAVIGHVWLSALVAWSTGRRPFAWVPGELAVAVHLLLDDRLSPSPRGGIE